MFFVFKQKTAYEMRISDWSSDVCSSDLLEDPNYRTTIADVVTRLPYLDAKKFQTIAMPVVGTNPWPTSNVHRAGFDAGFFGPHILIPQGVERDVGRVRAAYREQRSEEQTSELQSLMRNSYAVFCLEKNKKKKQ